MSATTSAVVPSFNQVAQSEQRLSPQITCSRPYRASLSASFLVLKMPRPCIVYLETALMMYADRGDKVKRSPFDSGSKPPAPLNTTRETRCGMRCRAAVVSCTPRWRYDS